MNLWKLLARLSLLTIMSGAAHAACSNNVSSQTLNYGTVYIQRDTPVNTPVGNILSGPQQTIATCQDPSAVGVNNGIVSILNVAGSYNGNTVFSTPLTGVGIMMGVSGGFSPGQWSNFIPAGKTYDSYGYASASVTSTWIFQPLIQFVKTATTSQSGTFSQQIGYYRPAYGSTSFPNGTNNSGNIPVYATGNVVVVACTLTTPNLTFPIGDVLASSFGSSVGVTPSGAQNTQNLGLNCDANANINVSLSGTQNPDVGTTSVLALTNQGTTGVAKGVGVQIVYNGTPLQLNNRLVLKKSTGGQETFPLTARYYQTKTSVGTGTANASATLNLTYQ